MSPKGENKPAGTLGQQSWHRAKPKGPRQRTWRPSVLSPKGENKPAGTLGPQSWHGATAKGAKPLEAERLGRMAQ